MAIRVQVGTPSGVQASIHKDNPINTELKKVEVSLVNLEKLKNVDTLINGHNPTTTTMADLKTQGEFIQDFVTFVQAAKKGGKTVDDVVAAAKAVLYR